MTKAATYEQLLDDLDAILTGETNAILKMSTINCLVQERFPEFFWVGFYCMDGGELIVGPYQGTMGCLHIPLSKGICGRAARTLTTQIVADVHADPEHVACDSRTNSEIVVPVFDSTRKLIAVFDIDSTAFDTFDSTDRRYLEWLVARHFATPELVMAYRQ